jgi:biotin-(acetyl-CoA carboxylase) ligase
VPTDSATGLPELPSLFTPVIPLREGGDAMARAVAVAAGKGAGTLVWVRSSARVEAAVVLEPEQPLGAARPALFAALNAFCDALGAFGPPDVPVTLRWPGVVVVNGGEVGQARLAWAPGTAPGEVPEWMVVGIEARLSFPDGWEPGFGLQQSALRDEGWTEEEVSAAELTAAWARHLMAGLAEWQAPGFQGGFRRLAEKFLARLEPVPGMVGGRRGLDPATGDLVVERDGARHVLALTESLATAPR